MGKSTKFKIKVVVALNPIFQRTSFEIVGVLSSPISQLNSFANSTCLYLSLLIDLSYYSNQAMAGMQIPCFISI
uniref:Uncharacterized protein n=1 Tax=Solanum tuberosum TaxID=4113 RepID=M1D7J0_SOLTU